MTAGLPVAHRVLLAVHRILLRWLHTSFPEPWAADVHETARVRVAKVLESRGWLAGAFTAAAECGDVAAVGLGRIAREGVLGGVSRDVRQSLRRLVARPARSLSSVTTLAVGIGASTALFSVVNNTLLRPMLLRNIDRLVRIDDVAPDGSQSSNVSPLNADILRRGSSTLSTVIVQDYRPFVLTGQGDPERLRGSGVSEGFTRGLGITPVVGRTFTAEESRLGSEAPSVLVSYDLWQRRWAGRLDALGATVVLNGRPRTVVGVLPRGFHFPYEADIWVPLSYDASLADNPYLLVFGRIADGIDPTAVQHELDALSADARRAAPRANRDVTLTAMPLRDNLVRGYDRTAVALLSVVGFLLLVGALNIATMGLADARGRTREMAIRASLGASRSRQITQLLTESTVVAFLGGAAGLGLSVLLRPFLSLLVPPVMSVELAQDDIVLDHRVVLFAVAAATVAALVSGVFPAARTSVRDLAGTLRSGGGAGTSRSGSGLSLVAVEVALAVVLLTGAASVAEGWLRYRMHPLGYRPEGVLTLRASLPEARYASDDARVRGVDALVNAIAHTPGVQTVGVSTGNPALGGWIERVSGDGDPDPREAVQTHLRLVTPGFFPGLGVSLVAGRLLGPEDDRGPPSAVVSVSLARRLWGDERAALGHTVILPAGDATDTRFTVVGVCADVREEDPVPSGLYLPYARHRGRLPAQEIDFFVRASDGEDPATLGPSVRMAVRSADRDLALFGVEPQVRVRSRASALEGAGALLASGLIGFGLMLSAIGVFGVMSNLASRSMASLGIRKALGARPSALLRTALGPVMAAIGSGAAAGALGAWTVTGLAGARFPGAGPSDAGPPAPTLYAVAIGVMVLVALLAALGPVVRAVLVDPARLLRAE